jgi:hypothetical protein
MFASLNAMTLGRLKIKPISTQDVLKLWRVFAAVGVDFVAEGQKLRPTATEETRASLT